ncbi:MAG: hypothetical protein AB7O97_08535 [Planctomycetota bacterium]
MHATTTVTRRGIPARRHPAAAASSAHPASDERGVALIFALFFAVIALGVTIAGTIFVQAHRDSTATRFASNGQAVEFARSGLIEAIGWFRKQTAQPVTAFEPILDEVSSPPVLDTIEPEIGIVREFEISGSLWGRYEVWKQWDADTDTDRKAFREQVQCEDISAERGNLSPGSVWRVRSIGYVFRRSSDAVAFDVAPNRVVAKEMVETEIRRLALQPPGQAALCVREGSTCRVLTRGRVYGGTTAAGICYSSSSAAAPVVSGTGATVTPGSSPLNPYNDSMIDVFGVSLSELKGMADSILVDPAEFPSPLPRDSVVVAETDLTFTAARPLAGTGVVVVSGDVTIDQASYSSFSGLLYVDGNLVVREPSELQGAIVVTGSVTVQGASDYATITFDDGIVNRLRQTLGTYRQSSATTRPFHGEQR